MIDPTKRQELIEKLSNKIRKASSNVSTKVEAEKGDFKVVISSDSIDHFYKGNPVAAIRVADLDDGVVEFINHDPGDAAQEMLSEFTKHFDPSELDKMAKSSSKITKEAANAVQDEKTWDMITQKQMDEQKVKLHPRWQEYYTNITQKQIPEHGQRPGTYDVITQGQLRDERTTFYGADRTAGDWKQEDRNLVTEGQFEEGVGDYSEAGQSDRDQIGSKYDGGLEMQHKQIGEKQLMELLTHHKWEEPLTVTEGKDQLGQQDGELSRLTAEVAQKIIKEALDSLAKTVLSAGVTPTDVVGILQRLVSHDSKYPVLADTLNRYAKLDISAITKKIAKAQHFGKTANTGNDWSDFLVADVLVRQLAKINTPARHVVDGLISLANRGDLIDRINTTAENILDNKVIKEAEGPSLFDQVLDGEPKEASEEKPLVEGKADDGLYSYKGAIKEVKADPMDKEAFTPAAIKIARKQILSQLNEEVQLEPLVIDVNGEEGTFEVQFENPLFQKDDLEARAERRRQLAKEASGKRVKKEAQMPAGGMPPAAGPDMGNPAAPPGGADMGAPPAGEALSQEPPMEGGMEEGPSGEPKPPGSVCPVCGSEDVDVDNGEFRCNNCGGEGQLYVDMHITKWPETIQESEAEEEGGFGLGEEGGMGAEEEMMDTGGEGDGATLPNVPVAASVRITGRMLEKLAEQKIQVGKVCPNCGSSNTDTMKTAKKSYDGICWDCLQEFTFRMKADKKASVYTEHIWRPQVVTADCNGCNRLHQAFVDSLEHYGMSWGEFEALANKDKIDTILKLAKKGWLNLKTAMKTPLPMEKIAASARWQGYSKFDKFPSASCRERIARRFGENATSMSGPCEGMKLAECVCGQLETLGIYTDGLAAKVAAVQSSKDVEIHSPMKTCISMLVRHNNLPVDDACTVCDALRAAYASAEELAIEAIAQIMPQPPAKNRLTPSTPGAKPMAAPGKPMPTPKPMPAPADVVDPAVNAQPMGADSLSPAPEPAAMPSGAPAKEMPAPMEMGAPAEQAPIPDMGQSKPMEPNPLDEPIADDVNVEISGDLGGEMGGLDDMGIGLEGDMITIDLPEEAVDALQVLFDALQGQIGGNDMLDMGDVTDETVDESTENEGVDIPGPSEEDPEPDFGEEDAEEDGSSDEGESDIPGLVEDGSEEKDILVKESPSEEHKATSKEVVKEASKENPEGVESETKEASVDDFLYTMKTGTLRRRQDSINTIFDGLLAQAKVAAKTDDGVKKVERSGVKDSKIKQTPAQDTEGIGKYKDGGKIGHEEAFTSNVKNKPDVPRASATLGDEGSGVTVDESGDQPSVPHGSPLMDGEKHYPAEKGNEVDGNQGGGIGTSAKSKEVVKTAAKGDKRMKTATVYTVPQGHKYYDAFLKKAEAGDDQIKLEDGNMYDMNVDQNKNIVLVAKKPPFLEEEEGDDKECMKPCGAKPAKESSKTQKSEEIKKESQSTGLKNVKKLEDDPDINQSSGPGKGKVKGDQTHSLGVDEIKPSEGMDEPSTPDAPAGGQLAREHTYTNETDGPEVPAGSGRHPEYDQNEKNEPEKQEQILGKENDIAAMASVSQNEAIKIAGQLLKLNEITADELPDKVKELSQATPEILADIKKLITKANVTKGMRREASKDAVETGLVIQASGAHDEDKSDLKSRVQNMFSLNKKNQDYERLVDEQGNHQLWR